jgi:hypothetical protein
MLQLRGTVQQLPLGVDFGFECHDRTHPLSDPTRRRGAWNFKLRKGVRIACSSDLRFDPMVPGTALAMGHPAHKANGESVGSTLFP